jgi:hypothetical protein
MNRYAHKNKSLWDSSKCAADMKFPRNTTRIIRDRIRNEVISILKKKR